MWVVDVVLIVVCGVVLYLWAANFPYPSALIRGFLPPVRRWPEKRIREWLVNDCFDKEFLRYFYRDPERTVPVEPGLVAPADGLVTSTDVRDDTRYIVIALSFWDMHVQRSPLSGTIESIEAFGSEYMDGEGRNFAFLRTKCCPVQNRVTIRGMENEGVVAVRLITSLSARRIELWAEEGDMLTRGDRVGRILLGSTVVLELPASFELLVVRGQRVWAGETLVAVAAEAAK